MRDAIGANAYEEVCAEDLFVKAVGHRVVHGGELSVAEIVVNDDALSSLHKLGLLASLHQLGNLKTIEIPKSLLSNTLQIVCF